MLEVNCASVTHPPLREFDRGLRKLALFDEASTALVLQNRRLFQCPNCVVTIGCSPTNNLAYGVYLNDTGLIVATNTWKDELAAIPESEAAWLRVNMVFVDVVKPLFAEQPASSPCTPSLLLE